MIKCGRCGQLCSWNGRRTKDGRTFDVYVCPDGHELLIPVGV